jgi:pyruvate dehydrogenase E1 component alpha subunit
MFEATRIARERAIASGGPTLIEAVTMRMHGHGAHDDMKYVPKEMFEEWAGRDPVERYEQKLQADGIDVDAIRAEAKALVDEDTDWALAQPMPDPATATDGVFAEKWEPLGDGKAPWSHWAQESANA